MVDFNDHLRELGRRQTGEGQATRNATTFRQRVCEAFSDTAEATLQHHEAGQQECEANALHVCSSLLIDLNPRSEVIRNLQR